jgi:hypothetical protein
VTFEQVGAAHVARDGAHVLVAGHVHHTGPPWSRVEQVGGYAAVRLREIRLRFPTDCPGWIRAWVSPEGEVSMWRPIATAPRDGTKVDLLYPHPRGRMINCFWHARTRTWMWRTPRWQGDTLLPEHQWDLHYAPDAQPTHWRLAPMPPQESVHRASLDQPRG